MVSGQATPECWLEDYKAREDRALFFHHWTFFARSFSIKGESLLPVKEEDTYANTYGHRANQ